MFAYCRNNPVCRVDTTGYTDKKVQDDGTTEVGPDEDEIQGGGVGSTTAGNGTSTAGNGTSTSPYMGGTYPAGQYYPNNPSTNPQYQPPKGGGGATSSTNVKGTQVDFSHGGRHIDPSKYNYLDIQENIAYDAVNQASIHQSGGYVKIIYDGLPIRYSYYLLGPNHINVGTYFIEIDY